MTFLIFWIYIFINSFVIDITLIPKISVRHELYADVSIQVEISNSNTTESSSINGKFYARNGQIASFIDDERFYISNSKYKALIKFSPSGNTLLGVFDTNSIEDKYSTSEKLLFTEHSFSEVCLLDYLTQFDVSNIDESYTKLTLIKPIMLNNISLISIESAIITLDRKQNYKIISAEYQEKRKSGIFNCTKQLNRNDKAGFSYNETSESQDKKFIMKVTTTIDYLKSDFTDSVFTLSHYGLPEPEGVVWEKPTPNWVWLLVVAGCLALVAVILGTLKRRLARA